MQGKDILEKLKQMWDTPDDEYESPEYHIRARIIGQPKFNPSPVYAFLSTARTLKLSTQEGYYFKIQQVLGINPTTSLKGNEQVYDIGFIIAPFKYYTDNEEITVNTDTITNPGTRYSRPVYKITHSGACTLTVNGQELNIASAASSPIFIDAERMFAYNSSGENQTKHTTGQYPFLQPGQNAIASTGAGLTVVGNWRDY